MRFLCFALLASTAVPALAQGIELSPTFGTQFRYEQTVGDRLLGTNDAFVMRARPGVTIDDGSWSLTAQSDAAVVVRRTIDPTGEETSETTASTASRPDSLQLNQFALRYTGVPGTTFAVGRQQIGLAANYAGDRDGEQTFDAARVTFAALPGLHADLAYAWSSRSLWAREGDALIPETVGGQNIFAKLDWQSRLGTLSTYAYQVDQRHAAHSDFRLMNQVYGARFTGTRKLATGTRLDYAIGYNRQDGALTNGATIAPTYWLIGSTYDLNDLSATQTNYRRFAANGIAFKNGDEVNLSTTATMGRVNLGARFSNFRPIDSQQSLQDMRVSLGLIF
ncbi:hypothetical protein [Sphingomonas crocodyli]|uniref:Porin n=1 Tax=Sphingomonas crocodyli TaxID=1979270 RepID=A0A437LVV1_9SPHN|nr:hypothetical protein [Sphingomonas crocodyli]RVT89502.1 hypothetical protein EOD43_22355 [Sphingomonas crocodyli]